MRPPADKTRKPISAERGLHAGGQITGAELMPMRYAPAMQLESPTLRPLGWLPRQEFNGAADFDSGQNYTRPARTENGPWPWPTMIGAVSGLLPQLTEFLLHNVQTRPGAAFYVGGDAINIPGGMSFGYGINGLKKVKG
jgi:hypothetical protein